MTKPEPTKDEKKIDIAEHYAEHVKAHPLPQSDKPRGPDHEYLH